MKYEINQAQYRDFLNTLTLTQQTTLTPVSPTSVVGTRVLPPTANVYRSYIETKTSSVSGAPAEYGCDANNNNVYDEADDGEWIPCHFLSWPDMASFMDWIGLAPMSELQFERICRGHSSSASQPAIFGAFAWVVPTFTIAPIL